MEEEKSSLKERTAKGLLWGMVNNGTAQLLGAVFGIMLLNRLVPEDYGKIAMLMVFTNIANALQTSGFRQALCNLRTPTHRDYNAVFWFNIGMSALIYLILFLSAPFIARFYNSPDLLWLSRYLFLGFFISSFGIVQRTYLFIHLMNKQTAIIGIVALIISGTVGVIMAGMGFAAWGLATQQILFILVVVIMNWYYSPWHPSWEFDLRPAWRMFGFSSKLLIQDLFNNLNAHAFGVLLGRFYGDHSAGVYSNARKWDDMGINTIYGMVQDVAQPVLTRVRNEQELYRNVFRKMLRFVCFISFPMMLGIGLIAREFLLIAAGEKWLESAALLSMLSIYGAFFPITTLYSNLTITQGRSDINLCNTIILCVLIWIGLIALHPWGLKVMVMFFITLNILWLFVWQWFAHRLIGLRLWDVLRDVVPFLAFTVLVMGATWWITRPITNLYLLLVGKIVIATTLYAGITWLSGAKIMRESINYIFKK
ncbi:MAG: lipopolysaccharide biosynthesis protein [Bacteroidaceae bacterium]|nr:lipopolysaccharide biosynthesis protein [Bacteroidaceae bacterium]